MDTVYENIHRDIIERCKEDDREAQLQLYKLYYKAMYNTSLRIVKNEAEAEDIMQESFLTAFQKLNSFKGDSTFGAWLKRIVVNNSINALNKKKDEVSFNDEETAAEHYVEQEEEEYEPEFNMNQILDTIQQLPDGYRVIVTLYLMEGYDHEEIAGILNISSATSRSQFNRGKKKLKQLLEETTWQN